MMDSDSIGSAFEVGFKYRTHFTRDALSAGNPLLPGILTEGLADGERTRVLFIAERELLEKFPSLSAGIEGCCKDSRIVPAAPPLLVEGGEACKRMDFALELCDSMMKARLCRKSFAVIVGGGALLDSAGFAAALVHRGVRQVRIPTTALAQCDSGVGVKNAVNFEGKKNFLGTFAPPHAVINDSIFLDTLPKRELASGAAEALKVSIIKDSSFFDWLCVNAKAIASGSAPEVREMVRRCAMMHMKHIATSGDPFETGDSRPLDFGHWAAHKLEMLSGGTIRHGEAVAIGMLIDSHYAVSKGLFKESDFLRLLNAVKELGLPCSDPLLELRKPDGRRAVLDGIEEFREHLGGRLYITLPDGLGAKLEVNSLETTLVEKAIEKLMGIAE